MWPPLSSRAVHRERVRPKALASERPCVICLMLRRLTLGAERFATRSRSGGKKIDKVLRARKRLPLATRQMDVSDSERGLGSCSARYGPLPATAKVFDAL